MIARGPQVEHLADGGDDPLLGHVRGAERLRRKADGLRGADRVGDLQLEPVREPGRDGVLRDPAHRVRGGAVDLRRVLAAERAAAVPARAAVGVDDDLAAGEARIRLRAADLEAGRSG